jgi:uncharacterized membrane protein
MGWLPFTTLVLCILGLVDSAYEVVRDGRICPYCTSVHVITFLLFSLIVFQGATPALHSEATSLQ